MLSEVVESVANGVSNPYEVISSEDMLSRIEKCNGKIADMRQEILDVDSNIEWDWRKNYVLIGSDVVSLFPSLTAENTATDQLEID